MKIKLTIDVIVVVANTKSCIRLEYSEKTASLTLKLIRKERGRSDQVVEKASDVVQVLQRLG